MYLYYIYNLRTPPSIVTVSIELTALLSPSIQWSVSYAVTGDPARDDSAPDGGPLPSARLIRCLGSEHSESVCLRISEKRTLRRYHKLFSYYAV